eukprot:1136666-Pelagomonas_calceolata.AAC.7
MQSYILLGASRVDEEAIHGDTDKPDDAKQRVSYKELKYCRNVKKLREHHTVLEYSRLCPRNSISFLPPEKEAPCTGICFFINGTRCANIFLARLTPESMSGGGKRLAVMQKRI